jgi:hypothetical protein
MKYSTVILTRIKFVNEKRKSIPRVSLLFAPSMGKYELGGARRLGNGRSADGNQI